VRLLWIATAQGRLAMTVGDGRNYAREAPGKSLLVLFFRKELLSFLFLD